MQAELAGSPFHGWEEPCLHRQPQRQEEREALRHHHATQVVSGVRVRCAEGLHPQNHVTTGSVEGLGTPEHPGEREQATLMKQMCSECG